MQTGQTVQQQQQQLNGKKSQTEKYNLQKDNSHKNIIDIEKYGSLKRMNNNKGGAATETAANENIIVVNNKEIDQQKYNNNSMKFAFLAQPTTIDYRPQAVSYYFFFALFSIRLLIIIFNHTAKHHK